jgi:acyl-coenzyme A synthetase/AMP-(fatty) acid ligase
MRPASALVNRDPDQLIAWTEAGPLTVSRFTLSVRTIAAQLPRKRFVFNIYHKPVDFMLAFCAATVAGQCTLMPPNRLHSTLEDIRNDYPDSYFIGPAECDSVDIRKLLANSPEPESPGGGLPLIPESQLCAIAFTSGSTGRPKANPKSWRTLRESTLSNAAMMLREIDGPVNMISTVPPQHMWGMETSVLLPLLAPTAIACHAPFYPQDLQNAISAVPAPRVLVSTPVHLAAMLESGLEFEPLERVLCATAPLSPSLAAKVEDAFRTRLLEVFGCTESGILASRFVSNEEQWTLADIFDLDTDGGNATITAPHLPGKVHLQDMIEKTGPHHFRWLGRHQDMVKIAGKRGSLVDLNQRLVNIPGVNDGVIFSPGEGRRLAAMVVAPGLSPAEIREGLRHQVESVFLPRPIVMVDGLPRSATGKLGRQDLLDLFEKAKPGVGFK